MLELYDKYNVKPNVYTLNLFVEAKSRIRIKKCASYMLICVFRYVWGIYRDISEVF